MKSIYSIISEVSTELAANDPPDSEGVDYCEKLTKRAKVYLRNVLDAVGVDINDIREKNNFKKTTQHKIGDDLATIIAGHAKEKKFPSKNKIADAIDIPSPLTAEIIRVAKLYLKDNFTQQVCVDLSKQIDRKFKYVIELIENDIKESNNLIDEIRKNMVSLKFRAVQSTEDIYKIIYEMYYFIENYSPDETPYLTEDELAIIDFIRLNIILDNIYKDMQFKNRITSLSLKK